MEMARLISAQSASGSITYFINVDRVNYVQQSTTNPGQCIVHFDGEQNLTIGMSAENFSGLAFSRG
jgi:hypothetical protein